MHHRPALKAKLRSGCQDSGKLRPGALGTLVPGGVLKLATAWAGRSRRHWWLLAALCLLGIALPGRADTNLVLKLKNGDRVTGKFISEDTNQVTIATVWIKQLSIPLSQVVHREVVPTPSSFVSTNAPRAVAGGTNPPPATIPSTNQLATAKGATNVPPAAVTLTTSVLRPALPQLKAGLHGELQVGTDLNYASVSRQLYYGRAKLTYSTNHFRGLLDFSAGYGLEQGVVSENKMDGTIKNEYDITKRSYVYNLGGGGYDQIQLIKSYFNEGPGMGYHLLKKPNQILDTEMGFNYEVRDLENQGVDRRFFLRFAELYAWRLSNKLSIDEKFEFTPQAADIAQYQFRLEANARYNLIKHVTFNFTIIDFFDSQPATGTDKNSIQVRSSIGLSF